MHRAIFVDRDGTVSEEVGYMYHAGLYKPFPWTGPAIRRINDSEFKAILTTNQSGVSRGYFTEKTIAEVHDVLKQNLAKSGAHLDAIYYCPHGPNDGCDCRKPKAGMLLRAAQDHDIDLNGSLVIGDRFLDLEMARSVGARGVLVKSGDGANELTRHAGDELQPQFVAENLLDAVEAILEGRVG